MDDKKKSKKNTPDYGVINVTKKNHSQDKVEVKNYVLYLKSFFGLLITTPGGLKHQKFIFPQFGELKFEIKLSAGPALSGGSREKFLPALLSF